MAREYFVSMENTIGQVTWTSFQSKEEFDRFYADKMKDGSEHLVREAYPAIHYQGADMDQCQRVNNEMARKRQQEHPNFALASALANMGDMGLAKRVYEHKSPIDISDIGEVKGFSRVLSELASLTTD